jgi:hypothetical protein
MIGQLDAYMEEMKKSVDTAQYGYTLFEDAKTHFAFIAGTSSEPPRQEFVVEMLNLAISISSTTKQISNEVYQIMAEFFTVFIFSSFFSPL